MSSDTKSMLFNVIFPRLPIDNSRVFSSITVVSMSSLDSVGIDLRSNTSPSSKLKSSILVSKLS